MRLFPQRGEAHRLAARANRGRQARRTRGGEHPDGRCAGLLERFQQRGILVLAHAVGVTHHHHAKFGLVRFERQFAQQLARDREPDGRGLLVLEHEQRIGAHRLERLDHGFIERAFLARDREQELEIGMLEHAALDARGARAARVAGWRAPLAHQRAGERQRRGALADADRALQQVGVRGAAAGGDAAEEADRRRLIEHFAELENRHDAILADRMERPRTRRSAPSPGPNGSGRGSRPPQSNRRRSP